MAGEILDNKGRGEAGWDWPAIHPEGRKFGLIAVAASLFDCSFQCAVTHRVQGAKTPVFQFIFDVVNTEPIGDGRVEFQRFAGDTAAFLWF